MAGFRTDLGLARRRFFFRAGLDRANQPEMIEKCFVCPQQERRMLKTLRTVSTVLLTTAAFAQTSTTSPGSAAYAAGHKMQKSKTSTAPGASEYAPGHQKKMAKGHSKSAPGHQTTTG